MKAVASVQARDHAGVRLVRVDGEIDLSNAREMLDRISSQVPSDAWQVVVDLGGLTFLDSSGVAMLFRLGERMRRNRQELRLLVPEAAPIRRVMELTAVGRVIPIDAALDAGY